MTSTSTFVLGILGIFSALAPSQAQPLMPLGELNGVVTHSIVLIEPDSKVLSLFRNGDHLLLRTCAEGTLKKEVESEKGCEKLETESEIYFPSPQIFAALFEQALTEIDITLLSPEQRELLIRATGPHPSEMTAQERALLQLQLDALLAQKSDWELSDEDSDQKRIDDMNEKLHCEECTVHQEAQAKLALLISQILQKANEFKIHEIYKNSSDRGTIAYQVLRKLSALSGFVDAKDPVSGEMGKLDVRTGRIWFAHEKSNLNWSDAKAYCEEVNQALPSEADFALAEKHDLRNVFPEMKTRASNGYSRWFWSDTPSEFGSAHLFYGSTGDVDVKFSRYFRDFLVFARCVSVAPEN